MTALTERRRAERRLRLVLDVTATIAIVIATIMVIWANWPRGPEPPIPLPDETLALDGTTTKGDPRSRAVVIVYSDFQCPYCGRFARETLPDVERQYVATGRVRLAFHHLALPNHPRAVPAAIAAECAGRQGGFWAMHDELFANQSRLDDDSLSTFAGALGLDLSAFHACQADPSVAASITRATATAQRLRVNSTPSFFIGTIQPDGRVKVERSLRGAVSVDEIDRAITPALFTWRFSLVVALLGLLLPPLLIVMARRHRRARRTTLSA